jgi:hypothetical protein
MPDVSTRFLHTISQTGSFNHIQFMSTCCECGASKVVTSVVPATRWAAFRSQTLINRSRVLNVMNPLHYCLVAHGGS